jgi:hypothetical protein
VDVGGGWVAEGGATVDVAERTGVLVGPVVPVGVVARVEVAPPVALAAPVDEAVGVREAVGVHDGLGIGVGVGGVSPGRSVRVRVGVRLGKMIPPGIVGVGVPTGPTMVSVAAPAASVGSPLAMIVCITAAMTAVCRAPGGSSVPCSGVFSETR